MRNVAYQTSLPGLSQVETAVTQLAQSGAHERGAIFTRREVVDFILDLIGYSSNKRLENERLLEPCFGNGDFLLAAVERLLEAAQKSGARDFDAANLKDCIRAVELHRDTFHTTRVRLSALLESKGVTRGTSETLLNSWLMQGDFLLMPLEGDFDYVVGNPPYVRQELIPDALMAEYRRLYRTIYDRADIYIPFIERSLSLLSEKGAHGFICADRWMKNRYGGPLRSLVANKYHLKFYVDMFNTPAFYSEVIAYPAITVITKENGKLTRLAHRPEINERSLSTLARKMLGAISTDDAQVKELKVTGYDSEPWILESFDQLAVVRRLEREFPTLEDAGCKVGIGVATGADKVFVASHETLDVEADRKIPLVMTRDIADGVVNWRGFSVINPFDSDGRLVNLNAFPRLRQYLEKNGSEIRKRHVSRKNPNNWYRTIDRIYPEIAHKPKLLIPDIKGSAHIVYESGTLYPHHNLYFITSDSWHLRALQAVLISGIARLFVTAYSTKMHGGFLRFQAQYLRRIRIPEWGSVSVELREKLIQAAEQNNLPACRLAVSELYQLSETELTALGGDSV